MGDLNRRLLRAVIDPRMEQPFLRSFKLNPLAYVKDHRMELVNAALTVLKAFVQSGAKRPEQRLASFEIWSDLVRGAVIWIKENGWLDVEDPVGSLAEAFTLDPETRKLRAMLNSWQELFGGAGGTVPDVLKRAESSKGAELDPISRRSLENVDT